MVGYRLSPPMSGFSFCCRHPQLSHENISGLKGFKLLPCVEYSTFVHWPFCAATEMFVPLLSILKSGKEPWNKSQMHLWSVKPHQFASVTFVKQGYKVQLWKSWPATNCWNANWKAILPSPNMKPSALIAPMQHLFCSVTFWGLILTQTSVAVVTFYSTVLFISLFEYLWWLPLES